MYRVVVYDFLSFINKYHSMVAYSRSLYIVSPSVFIFNESVEKVSLRKTLSSVYCSSLLYLFRLSVPSDDLLHLGLDSYRLPLIHCYLTRVSHANPGPYRYTFRRLCTIQ